MAAIPMKLQQPQTNPYACNKPYSDVCKTTLTLLQLGKDIQDSDSVNLVNPFMCVTN